MTRVCAAALITAALWCLSSCHSRKAPLPLDQQVTQRYGAELCERVDLYAPGQNDPPPSGSPRSATYFHRSPDAQHYVYSQQSVIGSDWRIFVRGKDGAPVHVVTLEESDPGSGISHRYMWSRDSRALLIGGAGGVRGFEVPPYYLALVYIVNERKLYRVSACRSAA
jgi:hypothetical protein